MRFLAFISVLALVVLAYTIYWFSLSGRVRDEMDRWIVERRGQGVEVRHEGYEISGFPFYLSIDVKAPSLALPAHVRAPTWRAEGVYGETRSWSPRHWVFEIRGDQTIGYAGPRGRREIIVRSKRSLASLVLGPDGAPRRLSFDVDGLEAALTEAPRPLKAARVMVHLRRAEGQVGGQPRVVDFALRAEQVALPAAKVPTVPRRGIEAFTFEGSLLGRLPLPLTPLSIAAWRNDGGSVDITSAEVRAGPIRVRFAGSVALDREMRPAGSARATVEGFKEAVEILRASGSLTPKAATTTKLVLSLLAKAPPGGGPKAVTAELRAQDGRLYFGPATLAKFGPLLEPVAPR